MLRPIEVGWRPRRTAATHARTEEADESQPPGPAPSPADHGGWAGAAGEGAPGTAIEARTRRTSADSSSSCPINSAMRFRDSLIKSRPVVDSCSSSRSADVNDGADESLESVLDEEEEPPVETGEGPRRRFALVPGLIRRKK